MLSLLVVLLASAPLSLRSLGSNQESSNELATTPLATHKGHRHHHHGHHKKHAAVVNASTQALPTNLLHSTKTLTKSATGRGELEVNGPLPADFSDRFAKEVAKATGCKPEDVRVLNTTVVEGHVGVDEIIFEAPPDVIKAVSEQAADPDSKLAKGPLRIFLVEKADAAPEGAAEKAGSESAELAGDAEQELEKGEKDVAKEAHSTVKKVEKEGTEVEKEVEKEGTEVEKEVEAPLGLAPTDEAENGEKTTPVEEKGIDIDTSMPYGELEPFGREDTAQELTKGSIRESDEMVDQLERAEVAEEKRAVFRALTRLRGAAITSFDGVARSQTGNIDSYARTNHWRSTHPVRHLADEESDVNKWAFPDNADF